jgi:hypothetical protein
MVSPIQSCFIPPRAVGCSGEKEFREARRSSALCLADSSTVSGVSYQTEDELLESTRKLPVLTVNAAQMNAFDVSTTVAAHRVNAHISVVRLAVNASVLRLSSQAPERCLGYRVRRVNMQSQIPRRGGMRPPARRVYAGLIQAELPSPVAVATYSARPKRRTETRAGFSEWCSVSNACLRLVIRTIRCELTTAQLVDFTVSD